MSGRNDYLGILAITHTADGVIGFVTAQSIIEVVAVFLFIASYAMEVGVAMTKLRSFVAGILVSAIFAVKASIPYISSGWSCDGF